MKEKKKFKFCNLAYRTVYLNVYKSRICIQLVLCCASQSRNNHCSEKNDDNVCTSTQNSITVEDNYVHRDSS